MSTGKWAIRKVRGYWTVIPPASEKLPGYAKALGGYPFGKTPAAFTIACAALREHLDRRRT